MAVSLFSAPLAGDYRLNGVGIIEFQELIDRV
jgi:hypothetical protein